MKRQAGFTLLEMTAAMVVLLVGGAGVMQMLGSMGSAATVQRARVKAVDRAQILVEALSIDLSQSTTEIDPTTSTNSRLWVLDSGRTVKFQRVYGVETTVTGEMRPAWTEDIVVTWNPDTGIVTRQLGTGTIERIAGGVVEFEARELPDGLMLIRVVTEDFVKGEPVRYSAQVHIKTRN